MSRITIHLADATLAMLDQATNVRAMSRSRWVAEMIRKHAAPEWPKECLDLAGRFADFPLQAKAPASGQQADVPVPR